MASEPARAERTMRWPTLEALKRAAGANHSARRDVARTRLPGSPRHLRHRRGGRPTRGARHRAGADGGPRVPHFPRSRPPRPRDRTRGRRRESVPTPARLAPRRRRARPDTAPGSRVTTSVPPYRLPRGGRNEAAGIVMGAAGAVVGTIGLAVWAATQYVAFRLHFDPRLGAPLLALAPVHQVWLGPPAVVVAALGVASLTNTRTRGWAGWLFLATGLLLALRIGPLYPPFQFFLWWWRFGDTPGTDRHLDDGHVDRDDPEPPRRLRRARRLHPPRQTDRRAVGHARLCPVGHARRPRGRRPPGPGRRRLRGRLE